MYIIGFDVSKTEIIGVKINKRSEIKERYMIPNTKEAIEKLLDAILIKHKRIILGSEATGEYHNILALSSLGRNLPFYIINPIVTKQFTKATVRKRKTDLTDAHVIARCILQGEGELARKSCFESTKPILRTASELSRLAVAVNHMQKRFVEHFPGENSVQEELNKLKTAINQTMSEIREQGIQKTSPELQTLLSSIPGIGKTLAAVIIAEIGDIERFHNAKALVAYAGLDPKVRQSGYTLKRNTKLTKRGSPYLRRAVYLAASIAQRHDSQLNEYYLKKRREGKRYKEATVANARHLLHRIYAVWKRKTPYIPVIHS